MDDVAIAGAGPAGALAAILLARAGVRVRVFDRARFPRHKLCGDTLNPGALRILERHLDVSPLVAKSDPIAGMMLTGPGGVRVRAEYGGGLAGRAVRREVLDQWLLDRAIEAGASVEQEAAVRDVIVADGRVAGVRLNQDAAHPARMVIAADGRRSTIAIGRRLSRQPDRPRRWAIGAYFTDVDDMTPLGEMHVRRGHYIGVAPIPGGLTNACVVIPHGSGEAPLGSPAEVLNRHLRSDPELAPRFARARAVSPPVMLGPMAVDAAAAGEPGLLLAGDAAGFIDPMTGDGLRFALLGAELAAATAIDVLSGVTPIDRAHLELAARRRAAFHGKWRFNRALRALVASPPGVTVAAVAARALPSIFSRIIRYSGDCEGAWGLGLEAWGVGRGSEMPPAIAVSLVTVVAALLIMLGEAFLSSFNERLLRARGAIEPPGDVIETMRWAYPFAFVVMGIEGALTGPAPPDVLLGGLAVFGLAKALKIWAIAALGPRWTFRVLVLQGEPLVASGPYRFLSHPNYLAVVGEIGGVAATVWAPITGVLATMGFGWLILARIRIEDRALGRVR